MQHIYQPHMPIKTKINKRRKRTQRRRTCKKGGMRRAMGIVGKAAGEVLGKETVDKADKVWQVAEALKKAAEKALTPESRKTFNHTESHMSFASLLSPFRRSAIAVESPRPHSYDEAMHKTPNRLRRLSETDVPPNLPPRNRKKPHAETSQWAITSLQPRSVVTQLFPDDVDE